ncbi:hypothetical protein QJQ45_022455 [Haematococcus lacustris]|nr:hypothetical protein QJQ45_022455 [Haematococcus lacustris]
MQLKSPAAGKQRLDRSRLNSGSTQHRHSGVRVGSSASADPTRTRELRVTLNTHRLMTKWLGGRDGLRDIESLDIEGLFRAGDPPWPPEPGSSPALAATPPLSCFSARARSSRQKCARAVLAAKLKHPTPSSSLSELVLDARDLPGVLLLLLQGGEHRKASSTTAGQQR